MPHPLSRHERSFTALAVVVSMLLVAAGAVVVTNRGEPVEAAAETIPPIVDQRPPVYDTTTGLDAVLYLHAVDAENRAAAAAQLAQERREAAAAAERRRAARSSRQRSTPPGGAHRGYATWHECTAAVENGGDYGRSTNRSHFGRYQFSRSTWATYGGNPDTWGHASPAEQDAVFARAVAAGGEGHWRPYNGC